MQCGECCDTISNIRYGDSDRFCWCHARSEGADTTLISDSSWADCPQAKTTRKRQWRVPRLALTELISDSLTDITAICADSSENCSTASANPLPGLQSPTAVITPPVLLSEPPCSNSSPVPFPSRAPLTLIQQNSQLNSLSHGPTDNQRRKVSSIVFMGSEMSTTALACIDALFSEAELANGNTGGSFGYQKLDKHKLSYLSSALRQKFDSPSFEIQWENVKAKINSKCRGKRRTLVKRLKKQANN